MSPPPARRRAKIYDRPRFGVRITPRLWLPLAISAASTAVTIWWALRHWHHPG